MTTTQSNQSLLKLKDQATDIIITYADAIKKLHYNEIIQSVSHFTDTSNLDRRTYTLTVKVKNSTLDKVRKLIYLNINKVLTGSMYSIGSERPALLISDDIGGTKRNNAYDGNHHFHIVLIMPLSQSGFSFKREDFEYALNGSVIKIGEVFDVNIDQYNYCQSLGGLLAYNSKLVTQKKGFGLDRNNFKTAIYPYDFDMSNRKLSYLGKDKRKEEFNRKLKLFKVKPSAFFSELYIHHFGEEIAHMNADPKLRDAA